MLLISGRAHLPVRGHQMNHTARLLTIRSFASSKMHYLNEQWGLAHAAVKKCL